MCIRFPVFKMWICSIRRPAEYADGDIQNKCGPGQPPGPHCFVSAAPVDAALGGEVYAHETAFPKERTFLAHAADDPSTND